jgi:uncharacterized membrane protein
MTCMEYTYIVILHVIGTAIGAGGATYSDFLFYRVIKDGKIDRDEHDLLKTSSYLVWFGFLILICSGIGFLLHPEFSGIMPKHYAKILIVTIILINALLLHRKVFPLIHYHMKRHRKLTKQPFAANVGLTLTSGAISIISWYAALILGAWRDLEASLSEIMVIYLGIIILGIIVSQYIGRKFMRSL